MSKSAATPVHAGKVPLVSEVLDRLVAQAGTSSTPRSAMFQAALQVCTEELRRVKKGAEAASLATLVERARYLLMTPGASLHSGAPSAEPALAHEGPANPPAPAPMAPAEPLPTVAEPSEGEPAPAGEHDTAGAAEADPFPLAGEHAAPDRLEVDAWPPPPPHAPFEELFAGLGADAGPGGSEAFPAPSRRARRLALAGGAVFVAAAAAAWFLGLQPRRHRAEAPGAVAESHPTSAPRSQAQPPDEAAGVLPAAAAAPAVAAAPPAPPPAPTATAAPPATATPAALPARAAPAAEPPPPHRAAAAPLRARLAPADRTAVMVSPDWAGQGPIYALHFSSYHDRDKALSDAARIRSAYGQPTHVLKVDLGAEGVWYRVMAGEFASADQASSFRAELVARHVPDVAHVFRVTGPR